MMHLFLKDHFERSKKMPITFESSVFNVVFLLLYAKLVLYIFVGILTQLCGLNLPTHFLT